MTQYWLFYRETDPSSGFSLTISRLVHIFRASQANHILNSINEEVHMKLQPLGDRVVLKVEAAEEKTKGGLFIPQTAQEKTQTGTILAIGDDETIKGVKVGSKVMYDKYAGTTVKEGADEYLILHYTDLICVVG
jgi:chaperonin GroES